MQHKQCQKQEIVLQQQTKTVINLKQLEAKAREAYQKGDYLSAIQNYQRILQHNPDDLNISLNLASMYFTSGKYEDCINQCKQYAQKCESLSIDNPDPQPNVQAYLLFSKSIIKLKKLLSQNQLKFITHGRTLYPEHKVLEQSYKTVQQIQICQNEQQFMDKMFEKLLIHPKIRNFMTDESFLTKVQKMIRNPSLASALIKMDSRLEDVNQALLMAEDDTQGDRDNSLSGK